MEEQSYWVSYTQSEKNVDFISSKKNINVFDQKILLDPNKILLRDSLRESKVTYKATII